MVEEPQVGCTYWMPALNTLFGGWIPLSWSDDKACLYMDASEAQEEIDDFLSIDDDGFDGANEDELGLFVVRVGADGLLYDVEDSTPVCRLERDE